MDATRYHGERGDVVGKLDNLNSRVVQMEVSSPPGLAAVARESMCSHAALLSFSAAAELPLSHSPHSLSVGDCTGIRWSVSYDDAVRPFDFCCGAVGVGEAAVASRRPSLHKSVACSRCGRPIGIALFSSRAPRAL